MQIHETGSSAAGAIARMYTRQLDTTSAYSRTANNAAGRPRTDRVTLSATRQDMQRAQGGVANQSDVRAERISALRGAIAKGTYQVQSGDLAASLLGG